MSDVHAWIPDPKTRAELHADLHTTGADTGFWDDLGRPGPWPDDIDEWRPSTSQPLTHQSAEQPY